MLAGHARDRRKQAAQGVAGVPSQILVLSAKSFCSREQLEQHCIQADDPLAPLTPIASIF